jgi:hypothetical protein
MSLSKKLSTPLTVCLIICFLLSGCQLFSMGRKKLNEYCPGLKIDIDGVSWSGNGLHNAYILKYDHGAQRKVDAYFENKENGFSPGGGHRFSDIEIDDEPIIDADDNILCKTVDKGKETVTVVFNKTTRRIVIIEEDKK